MRQRTKTNIGLWSFSLILVVLGCCLAFWNQVTSCNNCEARKAPQKVNALCSLAQENEILKQAREELKRPDLDATVTCKPDGYATVTADGWSMRYRYL